MTSTLWKLTASALVLGVALAAAAPAAAQVPIRIGASMSLTGTYAKPGTLSEGGL